MTNDTPTPTAGDDADAPDAPPRHQPELVLPEVEDVTSDNGDGDAKLAREAITQPAKLIRIASMVRSLLDEVRRAELDDAGRRLLADAHERTLAALTDVLSEDLRAELEEMVLPFASETPSESEVRIAQAQLVGWLEGLFHGIQATMATQQMMAQQQLDQVRRQALNPGGTPRPGGGAYI